MRASYHHYHLLQVIISLVAVNNTSITSTNYEGMMWDVTEQGVQCVWKYIHFCQEIFYFYVCMILSVHM